MPASDESKGIALEVRYSTGRPVELADLGESFRALGKQYENFVHRHGFEQPGNARLYVSEVRTGSIIILLKSLLEQGSMVLKDIDVLAGFMTNLYDLIEYFRTQKSKPPAEITRDDATRLSRIVEPTAKDGSGAISFTFIGNTAPIAITNNIIINNETANAIQNNVRRFLGPAIPDPGSFQREVLYLEQMRGDPKSKVGDRGIIERFSTKPVKLHFMTPESKAAVLDRPYPFKVAHVIDGQVSTAKGEPALYKVTNVHETLGTTSKQKPAKKPAKRATAGRTKKKRV
ncbi:hypothetical protein [Bradyrhizobium sp.]|uniref:hypothetical protein n=1 Tax=Bradyrhizobium sp. TaxID=376 RepID=UPI0027239DF7|nr:hypothetical protein [Bradyrhizobium sp.]MDO9299424.1 hypothetical protein [Bradyrhizobium sp.]